MATDRTRAGGARGADSIRGFQPVARKRGGLGRAIERGALRLPGTYQRDVRGGEAQRACLSAIETESEASGTTTDVASPCR
jgi:hypothetical protein